MTWLRTLLGNGRLLATITFITVFLSPTIGHSARINLSAQPVENILPLIVQNGNPEGAEFAVQFTVMNDTAEKLVWRFRTEMLNPLGFEFHEVGEHEPFFASPFKSRPQLSHASQGPVILSKPVSLEPGKSFEVQAIFETKPGPATFPIRLLNETRNDHIARGNNLSHGIYFGVMLAFVVLFAVSGNITASAASKWFCLYLVALTLLNAHSHGYLLSRFDLSPENFFPLLRFLQVGIMFAYLTFAMSFLNATERYPVFSKCVKAFFLIGLIIAPFEIFSDSPRFRLVVDGMALIFLFLGIRCAHLALRDKHHGGYFFVAGYCLLLVVGVINYVASIPDFAPWNDAVDKITLALQSSDALVFGRAIFSQIFNLRQERDAAVNDKLIEYQEKLAISQKLRQSETNLHRARSLAERHRASIASTSHDLRQPIMSLNAALDRAKELSPSMAADFSTGLEFLDSVLSQSLATSRIDAEDQPISAQPEDAEPIELGLVLENVRRMFAAEADQKGLDLKIVPSSLSVEARVIDLVRIISNLVANAIRYTESGGVLVGARRRGSLIAIEVWDTGRGIRADQRDTIMQPYERGNSSTDSHGEGLGLSIVKQLADENGLSVSIRSEIENGSVFTISGLKLANRL